LVDHAFHLREARARIAPQRGQLPARRAQRALYLLQLDADAGLGHARPAFFQRRDLAGCHAVGRRAGGRLRESGGILREPQALLRGQHVEEGGDRRRADLGAAAGQRRDGLVSRALGRRHAGGALAAQFERLAQLQRGGAVVAAQVFHLRIERGVGPGAGLDDGGLGGVLLAGCRGQAGVGLQRHRDGIAQRQRA